MAMNYGEETKFNLWRILQEIDFLRYHGHVAAMAATSDAMVSPNLFIPPRGHQILHYWSGNLLQIQDQSPPRI